MRINDNIIITYAYILIKIIIFLWVTWYMNILLCEDISIDIWPCFKQENSNSLDFKKIYFFYFKLWLLGIEIYHFSCSKTNALAGSCVESKGLKCVYTSKAIFIHPQYTVLYIIFFVYKTISLCSWLVNHNKVLTVNRNMFILWF